MEAILRFLEEYTEELGAAAAIAAIIVFIWAILKWIAGRRGGSAVQSPVSPEQPGGGATKLTLEEFIQLRRDLKAELEAELKDASTEEKAQLTVRITELESQIANPDAALAEAQKRITDLEALLEREGNEIAPDRIAEARAALEAGDFSLADDLFAEIEARADIEVQRAARAAFGRGEVAEQEVRWADAATHYARAAQLSPNFDRLFQARKFAWRAGDFDAAFRLGEDLLVHAETEGIQTNLASAMNEHALTLQALGQFPEAETLCRQSLEIGRATIGEMDPDYAVRLNNLAEAVQAQRRFDEAETLYRQALEIGRATIGEVHPDYASRLSNLAVVVQKQGRFDEAEEIHNRVLEIDRETIGERHPDHAIHLSNLAKAVQTVEEAEKLYLKAMDITAAALGKEHPTYAIRLGNLGRLLGVQGKVEEAREVLRQALAIFEATLPSDHPHIAETQRRIDTLVQGKE